MRRRVVKARLRGGASLFASFKYHWWNLDLECGHTVERRIRWARPTDGHPPDRGWAALWHGVSLDRLPPEPKHATCELCAAHPYPDGLVR